MTANKGTGDKRLLRERRERLSRALAVFSFERSRLILCAWLLAALVAVPGLRDLRIETAAGSILARDTESWSFYRQAVEQFGSDESLTILFGAAGRLDLKTLERAQAATSHLESSVWVERVDSPSTIPVATSGDDGTVEFEPYFRSGSTAARDRLAEVLESDSISDSWLFTKDMRGVATHVFLSDGATNRYREVLAELPSSAGVVAISGVPLFRIAADERMRREIVVFIPLAMLVIFGLTVMYFRSWKAAVIAIAPGFAGATLTCGVMGLVAVPITIATVILPAVFLALGGAYVMHALCAACEPRADGLRNAFERVSFPVLLSGLTTTVGFLSMSVVEIEAVRQLGTFGALGSFIVSVASLTLVPALGRTLGTGELREKVPAIAGQVADRFVSVALDHRRMVRAVSTGLGAVAVFGVTQLSASTDVVRWFREDDRLRQDYERIRDEVAGISPLSVIVEAEAPGSVVEPGVLSAMESLGEFLRQSPVVGKVLSVTDVMRSLRSAFDLPNDGRIARSTEEAEQLLWLFESYQVSDALISDDRRFARIALNLDDNGSEKILETAAAAQSWWSENGPAGVDVRATGIMYEFALAEDAIVRGQLLGFALAASGVALLLVIAFGVGWASAGALLTNILPVSIVFGGMGLAGVPLDASTVVVACLVLGIGVDDSIHIAFAARGGASREDHVESVRRAVRRVGAPVVLSSFSLMLGFGVLCVSGFVPVFALGAVTAAGIAVFLLADLMLLPVLLVRARDAEGGG